MTTDARVTYLATHRAVPMTLLTSDILRGCNIHHTATVIRQEVDLGGLADMHSDQAGPDFAQRFLERFFEMRRLVPDSAMSEGFIERLRLPTGAPFAEVLLEAILAVETSMAFHLHDFYPIGYSAVVATDSPRRVLLIWECKVPKMSRRAARVGFAGCVELLPAKMHPHQRGSSKDFATGLANLERRARHNERSTTTAVLALAARRRDLPCETVSGPYLRLGHGASQRLIYASTTEDTSLLASQLARNKHRTNSLLAQLDLPIARQMTVATAADALAAASKLGYPVVIKPLKQKQAVGVTVGITSPNDIPGAFARADQASPGSGRRIIVEKFLSGQAHRLLVVGGRFIAALRTLPSTITGDGVRTIADLVTEANSDPLRNGVRLFPIPVDDDLVQDLERRGYAFGDVLQKDETIPLHSAANVALGGVHSDVTDSVHPDNQEMAIRASQAIGLNVAGIDFITDDISRSYKEVGGGIIEVNARPGLCMHTWPRFGQSRPAAAAVLELVFPAGTNGRIPVAVVTGRRRTMRVARELEAILRASGKSVALATRRGCFINGQQTDPDQARSRDSVTTLLRDKRVQMLVSCISPRRAVKHGLELNGCDVAAVMDRHVDRSYESVFQPGLEVVARATRSMVVVSAENKLAHETLSALGARRLILVAPNPDDPAIADHATDGGLVVTSLPGKQRKRGRIVLQREQKIIVSVPVARAHSKPHGRRIARRRTQARMFAVALAFGMGLSAKAIKAAFRSKK